MVGVVQATQTILPTPATGQPWRGWPSTRGSVDASSAAMRASDSGASAAPPMSATTPDRSRSALGVDEAGFFLAGLAVADEFHAGS